MADEDEVYRQDHLQYCMYAIAFTLVIFGVLNSLKLGPLVWLFAASISLTGIPVWLMLKGKPQFRSSVALLWAIHAGVNGNTWAVLSRILAPTVLQVLSLLRLRRERRSFLIT